MKQMRKKIEDIINRINTTRADRKGKLTPILHDLSKDCGKMRELIEQESDINNSMANDNDANVGVGSTAASETVGVGSTAPAVGVGSTAASDNVGVGSTAPDNVGVGSTAPSGTTQTDPDTAADGEQPAPAPDPDFS